MNNPSWLGRGLKLLRDLCPCLLAAMLAAPACSDDEAKMADINSATAPVTVTFLRHDNPNYRTADNAFFAEYMRAHPNVTIVDTTIPFNALTATLDGDLKIDQFKYDLVLIPPSWICSYVNNIMEVPADVVSVSDAQNTFFPAPLVGSTCGDKLVGLPVEYNLEYGGVVVNLDKYQAKFPGKTPGWTDWNAFIADAAALTEYDAAGMPKANGLDIDPDWPAPVMQLLFGQILQRGGKYWGPSGDLFNFNTPEARDGLAAMVSWLTVNKVMYPGIVPTKNTGVTNRLAAGATGYGWSDPAKPLSVIGYVGTWGVPSTVGQLPAGSTWHYGFFALPPMVGTEHKFVSDGGWAFAVPKTSKNPKVAWDIAKSMALSPEAMRKWSAVTGALPALRANGSPAAAVGTPGLAQVQPLLEHGQYRGHIPALALQTAPGAFVTNFFAAAAGTKTIEMALADLERTANEAIMLHRGK